MNKELKRLVKLHSQENNKTYGETWQQLRLAILKRDKYTCQECGAGANTVHHIHYGNIHQDTLISVCQRCHMRLHGLNPDLASPTSEQRRAIKVKINELRERIKAYDSHLILPFMSLQQRFLMPNVTSEQYWERYLRPYYLEQINEMERHLT